MLKALRAVREWWRPNPDVTWRQAHLAYVRCLQALADGPLPGAPPAERPAPADPDELIGGLITRGEKGSGSLAVEPAEAEALWPHLLSDLGRLLERRGH